MEQVLGWCSEINVFNFKVDEVLTVEKIIHATFLNPERAKFAKSQMGGGLYKICLEISAEEILQKILTEIPKALEKFNAEKIRLYDTSMINSKVNKE